MSKTKYQDPIQSATGKMFGRNSNISQRKLFGMYESTYCYQNKPDHWSAAQTLHRQKMGTASLYARLLLQDSDFATQVTAVRLDRLRRAAKPRTAADRKIKPYLRNQQMLTSFIFARLSADEAFALPLFDGYLRYCRCRPLDRPALLSRLAEESSSLKSVLLQ